MLSTKSYFYNKILKNSLILFVFYILQFWTNARPDYIVSWEQFFILLIYVNKKHLWKIMITSHKCVKIFFIVI